MGTNSIDDDNDDDGDHDDDSGNSSDGSSVIDMSFLINATAVPVGDLGKLVDANEAQRVNTGDTARDNGTNDTVKEDTVGDSDDDSMHGEANSNTHKRNHAKSVGESAGADLRNAGHKRKASKENCTTEQGDGGGLPAKPQKTPSNDDATISIQMGKSVQRLRNESRKRCIRDASTTVRLPGDASNSDASNNDGAAKDDLAIVMIHHDNADGTDFTKRLQRCALQMEPIHAANRHAWRKAQIVTNSTTAITTNGSSNGKAPQPLLAGSVLESTTTSENYVDCLVQYDRSKKSYVLQVPDLIFQAETQSKGAPASAASRRDGGNRRKARSGVSIYMLVSK